MLNVFHNLSSHNLTGPSLLLVFILPGGDFHQVSTSLPVRHKHFRIDGHWWGPFRRVKRIMSLHGGGKGMVFLECHHSTGSAVPPKEPVAVRDLDSRLG